MKKKQIDKVAENPSRRDFLKFGGVAAASATVAAGAATGFVLGRDPDADVGWGRTAAGKDMFFDRKPFEVDWAPTLIKAGKIERPERGDFLFERFVMILFAIKDGWDPELGWESCPVPAVKQYYSKWPERWPDMLEALKQRVISQEKRFEYKYRYAIAHAYDRSNYASIYGDNEHEVNWPIKPEGHPEKADYKFVDYKYPDHFLWGRTDKAKQMKFKSPAHASELIKKVSNLYGCSFVGITRMDPSFVFKNMMRGMPNHGEWDESIPEHWKSVIVLGVPMSWDGMYAAPAYGTSYEAYSRVRQAAGKLEVFLNRLGWAGRSMVPGGDYEMTLPPVAVQAGLGEIARNGCLLTPEVGPNIRLACVVTDLEFEYDKPINVGIRHFCKECKICADACPSESISKADEPDAIVRGWKVFNFNQDSCFRMWSSLPSDGQQGCRVCIAVCPYTRRNNWIHAVVKEADPRDPTGLTRKTLLAMQHNFFYYPDAEAFHAPHNGGRLAGYHEPPKWLRSEEYFENVEKTWEYDGNWEAF